ncbi:eukaryotic translation initiation factor 5B-like isoform X1 [Solanum tuberosum]|uniref:eukaryotic translation initiation factor 5B-like isoform X1 n=1 Tax=Solanum tuberosum TaxID=4113 RepID=UPI00073A5264|nr:PREDICTED: eukaryotic translation initiation factor 5B-like isoform X1 [Solanum tuberosum]XP_015158278.1 PREDICTED: eukaryotic translation initiation factor 5B-like isoform X1 [Solanum tuberosum]XP_015158279.1 PREDICTED: eukaryotic translation initiation factor 5B-like isoform X1 [Solanum tuberosum]XP_015158280.1 PREDICTED: eukaryotic translation initiation factor 5B-like isoform X1 [Solanum tuberosum]XP_015158281.1 PREDICTED: eukaryotic translation initiation factor 5B-like isoform X1 [Sola
MEDMKSVMSRIDKTGEGVYVQATTLGSLEALLEFLKTPGVSIPVSGIGIGPVHKKNVIKASVMLEKKKEYSTILAFDVKVTQGARELSDELGVKVFMADIIYHLFDQFKAYIDTIKEEKKKEVAEEAVLPCVLKIIPNCVFKKKDPIVLGVDVLKGIFRIEELELKKKQQETKAIETSRKAIPSMEKCKKQLMIANSDFMEKMEDKFLNLVSKLEEKDKAITLFMLSAE